MLVKSETKVKLIGDRSLSKRDFSRVIKPLRQFGVNIKSKNNCLPIEILGTNQEMIDSVIEKIDNITFKPENGKEYDVKVIKILEFGAVVEFRPGKEVLLHISEIAWERVENVEKHLNLGDIVRVKYMGIDPRTKKQKVSRKILLERPKKKE